MIAGVVSPGAGRDCRALGLGAGGAPVSTVLMCEISAVSGGRVESSHILFSLVVSFVFFISFQTSSILRTLIKIYDTKKCGIVSTV